MERVKPICSTGIKGMWFAERLEDGVTKQGYFSSEAEAQAFADVGKPLGNARGRKRGTAKAPDLPVGLSQTNRNRVKSDGTPVVDTIIVATVRDQGEIKIKAVSFGRKRSREAAIKIALDWRIAKLKEMTDE